MVIDIRYYTKHLAVYAKYFLWCPHIHMVNLQTNDGHSVRHYWCEAILLLKFFFGTKKIISKNKVMTNDIPTIILNFLKWDNVTWTKRIEYGILNCAEKKSKDKAIYSILIQKSKGYSAFDEQKVKNIAIEYQLQWIFPNPDYRTQIVENVYN